MNHCFFRCFIHSVLILCLCCSPAKAQTSNPCGVVARIGPANADSVVPVNTIISLVSNSSSNATSLTWLYDGGFIGITGSMWNYQVKTGVHKISLVASDGNCTDTTTVVYFSAGTAHNIDSILLASYGTYKYNEEATCIDRTMDSGFVIAGVQYPWDACGEIGVIAKLRDKGCIDWSKKFIGPNYCQGSKITGVLASADSSFFVVTNNLELAKLDKSGVLLWNNKYNLNNLGPIGLEILAGDPQGNLYTVTGFDYMGWTITKIDRNGNTTWNKIYRIAYDQPLGAQTDYSSVNAVVWLKGKLYVSGTVISTVNSTNFSFITRLDAATGAKEWQYGYTNPTAPLIAGFTHLALYDTLLMASSGTQGQSVTLINQQGSVVKSIRTTFGTSYGPRITKAAADKNGHIFMMQWTQESLPLQPYYQYYSNFAEIDTSLNKYWGLVFSKFSRANFVDAVMGLDNKYGAVGTVNGYVDDGLYASRDMWLMRADTAIPDNSCYYSGTDYDITSQPINQQPFQYLVDSSLSVTPAPGQTITAVDAFLQSRYTCPDFIDSCNFMRISGPVNLCNFSSVYTYRLYRNKKCTLVPKWNLPAGVTIVNQTDSSLSVKFPGFGIYTISALLNGCIPVKDSLVISLVSKTHPLSIGADTTICSGSSILLDASTNFFSYTWSDGSKGTTLKITQPGTYWVTVVDSCNNLLSDSIVITPFINLINAGPDRISCANDTLHLDAPGGFTSYEWSANYRISATNMRSVIVNPAVDTAYYLKAEKLPGCFAYDTIRIKVNVAPPVFLGNDTSFCKGDSLLLNAGNGFAQYLWSNGTALQRTTVYTAGNYFVMATDANGCKAYDTINITNVWTNPVVTLDHTTELCAGTTRLLQAGNFSSYQWQDGSSMPTFKIDKPGSYYVTVTDVHQCRGSDTVHLIRMLPLPANFLPADTAICSYGEVVLVPGRSYTAYLWNTGESSSTVTITRPGIYWLSATDAAGCTGTDSISVLSKQCMKGLYVPTAFSPNLDGKNDLFKPLIFGDVTLFEWVVYNRYGQVIFTASNTTNGWDGTVKGVPQNQGSFVWSCRFRFKDEAEQVKKGTVMLVR